MKTPEEIVPSQQIVKIHGNANFGLHRAMRDVVNEAVLKVACGFSNGSTALEIIRKHGLSKHYVTGEYLTHKGQKYLWSLYGEGMP